MFLRAATQVCGSQTTRTRTGVGPGLEQAGAHWKEPESRRGRCRAFSFFFLDVPAAVSERISLTPGLCGAHQSGAGPVVPLVFVSCLTGGGGYKLDQKVVQLNQEETEHLFEGKSPEEDQN